jgi:threonine/homoserine/homoserine lactone efflux protein
MIDALSLAGFALAMAIAMATPGPAIAALLARVLGRGTAGVLPFCAGFILGDVLWLGIAVLGLSLVAEIAQPVFAAIKWAGVGYLLFVAWKLWTAPAVLPADAALPPGEGLRAFAGSLALTLGNPKVVVFYTALAPAVIDVTQVTAGGFALMALTLGLVFACVLAAYVLLAVRARRLLRDARMVRRANRACGATMAGAAVAIALR